MTPQEFIAEIGPGAKQSCIDTGIPASVTLAQGALESGWGGSGLAIRDKNLFGIKGFPPEWTGPVAMWPTQEWNGSKYVTVQQPFRVYDSWQASLDDHARFFFVNRNYRPALAVRGRPNEFAQAIQAAGYATDPNYAAQLIEIMGDFNLYAWDVPQSEWVLLPWARV